MANARKEPACTCTNEICHHRNGEPCGKAVENPLPAKWTDRHGQEAGQEFLIGLCDECLERVARKE